MIAVHENTYEMLKDAKYTLKVDTFDEVIKKLLEAKAEA
jgi:predicted CopG family antitoxin